MAAQFKVGGKVVCIKSGEIDCPDKDESYKFSKGQTFVIEEIKICGCGSVALHVGFVRPKKVGVTRKSECAVCAKRIETLIVWVHSRYFVPLEETEFRVVTYTKILEEIPQAAN